MATTEFLEKNYWHDRVERVERTLEADTIVRTFEIPSVDYDELKPAIADTFSSDTTQIVGRVSRGATNQGSDVDVLNVTYIQVATGGFTNGFGETRRIVDEDNLKVTTTQYGVAVAVDSTGIPDIGDLLSGALPTGHVCINVKTDDKVWPGLWAITATYVRMKLYGE